MTTQVVIPEDIRKAARPTQPLDTSKLRFSKPKPYVAGLEAAEPELAPLQAWAVAALGSRKAMEAPLGERAIEKLQALMVMPAPQDNPWQEAVVLAEAHGLELVLEAVLTSGGLRTGEAGKDQRRLVRDPEFKGGDWRWVRALISYFDRAPVASRERLRELAAERRMGLSLATRVALASLFQDKSWAEADARELLASNPPRYHVRFEVGQLLPLVEGDETFEALAQLSTGYPESGTAAAIAVNMPPDVAVKRLLRLYQLPRNKDQEWECRYVLAALACFPHPEAAQAILDAALLVRDTAKAYFVRYPEHRPLLEARVKGRGKRPREYQTLLDEMERQKVAAVAVEASDVALPDTLANPPWLVREPPWPARDVPLVADGERVIPSPDWEKFLAKAKTALSPAEVLVKAKKNLLDDGEFMALDDDAALAHIPRLKAFSLWVALARFGLRALPAVCAVVNDDPKKPHADLLPHVRSPRLAAVAWRELYGEDWLLEEPELSAQGLIPELFLADTARRYSGELGLLRLCAAGYRAQVEAAASRYGDLSREVLRILDRDGRQRLPETLPQLSKALTDNSLPPLVTAEGPLPASTIATVGMLLSVSRVWWRHPGLDELRVVCTQESRDAFAWEYYQRTSSELAIAHLGGDACVRKFDGVLSDTRKSMPPGDRRYALRVLARVGTPLAIVLLRKHALLSPYADRAQYIEGILAEMARVRGTTQAALEDEALTQLDVVRSLPELDFGPRRFKVTLDEHLAPQLRDEAGHILPKLPKPTKKDDAEKAASAKAQLGALCLDLDDVRQTILTTFERAMVTRRGWDLPHFQRFILAHPLLWQVARRLVFSTGEQRFRVAEDKTFADAQDHGVTLAPSTKVFVAQPAEIAETELAGFRQLFVDYEIIQPFAQLQPSA